MVGPLPLPAQIDLAFRVRRDGEPGAPQHGLDGGAVWNEPVRRIAAIAMLDEVQLGKGVPVEECSATS